ncbi:hypothetical protein CVT26_001414 [Gymnopilus dilepis]|uniref:DUF659 domain-containing protein n=1 Tax=Gymnopilus dilepis TaxID=231916 RepID=A0A409WYL9_9AGAR|nr:hypothetical protein CVT26_001414 [Gymnopilus dilepis]
MMLLDLVEVPKSHTGLNLATEFAEVLESFGIKEKILSVTADNASNNDTMVKYLAKIVDEFPGAWEDFRGGLPEDEIPCEVNVGQVTRVLLCCEELDHHPHPPSSMVSYPQISPIPRAYDAATICSRLRSNIAQLWIPWRLLVISTYANLQGHHTLFSRATPSLATVIPAMDHIDKVLATCSDSPHQFSPAIRAALAIGKNALNRYYSKTDHPEVYRIAMVLHPRHKLEDCKKHGWEASWVDTGQRDVSRGRGRCQSSGMNHCFCYLVSSLIASL